MAMNVGSPEGAGGDPEVVVDINTTPLIDVMLVLLIMLIITIPMQTNAVKLDLPQGNPPPPTTPPQVVTIDVDFDGTISWNGQAMGSEADLQAHFINAAAQSDQPEIHLPAQPAGALQGRGPCIGRRAAPRHEQARAGWRRAVYGEQLMVPQRRRQSAFRACLPLAGLTTGAMLLGVPMGVATILHAVQAQAQDLQRDVGKPLEKAKELAAQKDFSGAVAQIDEAEKARHKSAEENFVIEEMRASVAQQSGDYKTAISADDELLNSGKLARADQQRLLMAEASSSYQLHDYAGTIKAIDRYQKAGGTDPSLTQLKIQCYYLLKDYPHAAAEQSAQIEAEIAAHQVPAEQQLQLLASCQLQTGDAAGLNRTMTHLVEYYRSRIIGRSCCMGCGPTPTCRTGWNTMSTVSASPSGCSPAPRTSWT